MSFSVSIIVSVLVVATGLFAFLLGRWCDKKQKLYIESCFRIMDDMIELSKIGRYGG